MKIFSFSGIDGAGKSTQISALYDALSNSGLRVKRLEFWDHVAAFSRWREGLSYRVFRGDQGVGSPEQPLVRRDKNVTAWPVTAMRFLLYLADAINLALIVRKLKTEKWDAVVFDRYIYDELANLPLHRRFTLFFAAAVIKIAPRPDAAFFIDADPETAWKRKPEYPVEFLRRNREAYLIVSESAGAILIGPASVEAIRSAVIDVARKRLSAPASELVAVPGAR